MKADAGKGDVLVSGAIPDRVMEAIEKSGHPIVAWHGRDPAPREFLEANIVGARALLCLLTDRVDEDLLDMARDLRVVSNYAVGYDNIDVGACTSRGIAVTNTPGVLTEATADLSFALLLAAARRVVEADGFLRAGAWKTWSVDLMVGTGVYGKTLGLVGFGSIGQAVARRARGFDMTVLYADPADREEEAHKLGATRLPLESLLKKSDFLSVHVPLTPETRGLLDADLLTRAREGSILINTSRGEVVDEEALYQCLTQGPLAAAGLDVFAREPLPPDHPFIQLDNVVLTPHIGSATRQARLDMGLLAVRNMLSVLEGKRPSHLVNPEVMED